MLNWNTDYQPNQYQTSDKFPDAFIGYHFNCSHEVIRNDTGIVTTVEELTIREVQSNRYFYISPFPMDWIPLHLSHVKDLGSLSKIHFQIHNPFKAGDFGQYLRLSPVVEEAIDPERHCRLLSELENPGFCDLVYYDGMCPWREIPEGFLINPINSVLLVETIAANLKPQADRWNYL